MERGNVALGARLGGFDAITKLVAPCCLLERVARRLCMPDLVLERRS
jgi:hypothetical protein